MEFLTSQFGYASRPLKALKKSHAVGAQTNTGEADQIRVVRNASSTRRQMGEPRVSLRAQGGGILTEAEMDCFATDKESTDETPGNGQVIDKSPLRTTSCKRAYVRVHVKAAHTKSVDRSKIPTLHCQEGRASTLSETR